MEPECVTEPVPATMPTVSRWRWWIHLLLLAGYPLLIGIMGWLATRGHQGRLMPGNAIGLLYGVCLELALFSLVFALALRLSRASPQALLLVWRGGWRPLALGLAYSVGLRVLVAVGIFVLFLLLLVAGGTPEGIAGGLRPKSEMLFDPKSLTNDPVYYWLMLTVVSFVLAGLREELWRAGMFAALAALFPKGFERWPGKLAALGIVALIFGLGHLPQGAGGVGVTLLLGLGLGTVMLGHRSIWEAVLAHGFFDASSFMMLHWLITKHPHWLPG